MHSYHLVFLSYSLNAFSNLFRYSFFHYIATLVCPLKGKYIQNRFGVIFLRFLPIQSLILLSHFLN